MHLKQEIIILFLLTGFFLTLAGCQYLESKNKHFKLNPPLKKIYKYSSIKTSEHNNKYPASDSPDFFPNRNLDTFKLNFSLESIASHDSIINYKLTFIDFYINKNKKPFKIILKNADPSQQFFSKDPFVLYDSIGSIIRGKSVEVIINYRGIVKQVTGVDELVKYIAGTSSENENHVKTMVSDYLSANALKDLLNRFLSAVPGLKVKEGDKWVRNVTLVTKAPVKLSNLYVFDQQNNDTASVSIQSIISAEQSEGGTVYMKGKGKGIATINYSTGMPYLFETRSETETTTTEKQYEYINKEHFLVKEYH
jgi:hypothetical protein